MSDDGSWKCPSCATTYPQSTRQCPACRISAIHSSEGSGGRRAFGESPFKKKQEAPQVAVNLPCWIGDARYAVVIPGGSGASWTAGGIYITGAGFYLLSENDGLANEGKAMELSKDPTPEPKRLATLSVFIPVNTVVRLVHGQFTGNFLEMQQLKKPIPLRLSNDGWARLMSACRTLGCKVEA